jgi:putative IMPACT (imprinted ancient) family translation regulator
MRSLTGIISDRGSKYAVSGAAVSDRAGIEAALAALKRDRTFARATHNSWAAILVEDGRPVPLKNDDGEAGAGSLILRMLERAGRQGELVVVTRWYGGVRLGGDRFAHVAEAVRLWLAQPGP